MAKDDRQKPKFQVGQTANVGGTEMGSPEGLWYSLSPPINKSPAKIRWIWDIWDESNPIYIYIYIHTHTSIHMLQCYFSTRTSAGTGGTLLEALPDSIRQSSVFYSKHFLKARGTWPQPWRNPWIKKQLVLLNVHLPPSFMNQPGIIGFKWRSNTVLRLVSN